jgi:hypothetical protein
VVASVLDSLVRSLLPGTLAIAPWDEAKKEEITKHTKITKETEVEGETRSFSYVLFIS